MFERPENLKQPSRIWRKQREGVRMRTATGRTCALIERNLLRGSSSSSPGTSFVHANHVSRTSTDDLGGKRRLFSMLVIVRAGGVLIRVPEWHQKTSTVTWTSLRETVQCEVEWRSWNRKKTVDRQECVPKHVTIEVSSVYFRSKDGTNRKIEDSKRIDMHKKCNGGATQKFLNAGIEARPPRESNRVLVVASVFSDGIHVQEMHAIILVPPSLLEAAGFITPSKSGCVGDATTPGRDGKNVVFQRVAPREGYMRSRATTLAEERAVQTLAFSSFLLEV
ncbi:hypothetical protein ARMSODRAFT_1005182 [Armillaria solidipes]|uniref:Uncharacterized protein n=1 Tax=Armillaria solidipes TaxID=1076256 RepID=A0A2H3BNX2_9AGAR|nr:hypothetical protein ARMSODRAFT_1005182 [Armillaria solidipes]